MTNPTDETFAYTGTIATHTVPVTGVYNITADSAQGGGIAFLTLPEVWVPRSSAILR